MMMKIYVITETNSFNETWVVKAFENANDAIRFCKEHNRNTCHYFGIEEIELEKSSKRH